MQRLDCVVQEYAWGDLESIPRLLGQRPSGEPAAELWMGAHPKAPSAARSVDASAEASIALNQLIAGDPTGHLGPDLAARFGQLPFLFKVLAAGQPLSIQTHPSLEQAKAGFARENAAGIALTAPDRTYRDDNHKPELICALTPFVAKVGCKPVAATVALFDALGHPGLDGLRDVLAKGVAGTLDWLLRMPLPAAQVLVAAVVGAAAECEVAAYQRELAWVERIEQAFPGDIGVVVALLLNHVELTPGQAVYLGAGNLHAYLHGTGIELMANSDNVVRGGLTPKNIDVEELLAVVDTAPLDPQIQTATAGCHTYESPVPEFRLTRCTTGAYKHAFAGPHIVISTEGSWTMATGTESVAIDQGQVVYVGADEGVIALEGNGTSFIASPGAG